MRDCNWSLWRPQQQSRIQPGQPRLLLLVIRTARPTLAEVPLADLSLFFDQQSTRTTPALIAGVQNAERFTSIVDM
jgi:hypothetical protein